MKIPRHFRPAVVAGLLLASLLFVSAPSQAATLPIDVDEDSYIRSGQPNTTQGGAVSLLVGDVTSSDHLRAVFAVPLTNSDLMGATITSATLRLTVSALDTTSFSQIETIELFQLTESFVASQVTWNDREASVGWTTAGGTFGGSPLATVTGNPATMTLDQTFDFTSSSLTALTQASIGSTLYFLVKLSNETDAARSIFRFGSAENLTYPGPQLILDYVPIPEPTTFALLLGGVGMLMLMRRRRSSRFPGC